MANRRKDHTGRRFGRLVAIERLQGPETRYRCVCDCGNEHVATGGNLHCGNVESCGCLRREQKQAQMRTLGGLNRAALVGQRFGRLLVVAPAQGVRRSYWLCQCDCGQRAVKMGKYLLNGDTQSCGCKQDEYRAQGNHKYDDMPITHRREYISWRSMKSRCYVVSSSNYRFYGARGVTVCDRWRDDFAAFVEDMGRRPEGLTLDRIDPEGHYEPSNCRWATWEVQHKNLRAVRRRPVPRATRRPVP